VEGKAGRRLYMEGEGEEDGSEIRKRDGL